VDNTLSHLENGSKMSSSMVEHTVVPQSSRLYGWGRGSLECPGIWTTEGKLRGMGNIQENHRSLLK